MIPNVDWVALDRLRAIFLGRERVRGPYWRHRADLESYDATFGQRIGWKWDAVLRGLASQGWTPPPGPVLDFGCGSGVAGRRFLSAFGTGSVTQFWLHDHASRAVTFAQEAAEAAFPGLQVCRASRALLEGEEPLAVLVVSHVLNELRGADRRRLMSLARRSESVIWVEPGTHADSRALIEVRESLREAFKVIAPCTHATECGLGRPGMERHWCHHFAAPPKFVFVDPDWIHFAARMGVDLRSLPYSYLVLDRRPTSRPEVGWSRILGDPRRYKGYAKVLACEASGVRELRITDRGLPKFADDLAESEGPRRVRWTTSETEVISVESLGLTAGPPDCGFVGNGGDGDPPV